MALITPRNLAVILGFVIIGRTFFLYAVAGKSGIAIAVESNAETLVGTLERSRFTFMN
jgi:hypothetical protein